MNTMGTVPTTTRGTKSASSGLSSTNAKELAKIAAVIKATLIALQRHSDAISSAL
ncbi:MAG: hypothetical protein JSS61_07120 [Verrucomicrobia bacterium]|nr:hypothetical protein [Verrucomicrobiota bacterium]